MGVRRFLLSLLSPLILLGGCDGRSESIAAAREAFIAFQEAVIARDREALERWTATSSRPALAGLDLNQLASHRMEIEECQAFDGCWVVTLRDPEDPAAIPHYVITRERGDYRVDLIATVGLNNAVDTGVGFQATEASVQKRGFGATEADGIR